MNAVIDLINRLKNSKSDLKWIALLMMVFTYIMGIWLFQNFPIFQPERKIGQPAIVPTVIPTVCMPAVIIEVPTLEIRNDRCIPASSEQLLNISSGLDTKTANVYIKSAWAVRSMDYSNVYFVAAMLFGPGMEDGVGPGVWAINGDPNLPGLTYSVGGYAQSFSQYPDGSKTDAKLSQYDDGWQQASDCALADKQ